MLDVKTSTALIRRLAIIAAGLTFVVILLGSYTRLTDAGLGCPDWPGCYGQLLAPHTPSTLAKASLAYPTSPVETTKAWTEMIHRYFAGSLSLLILTILIVSIKEHRKTAQFLLIPVLLSITVLFQAALGMWTVTLKLLPMVVMGHLLGGFTTLGLLTLLILQLTPFCAPWRPALKALLPLANLAFFLLILQLALGGWTSSNYAALVCPDFPHCQGKWLPPLSWHAFQLNAGWGLENPLMAFGNIERVTIHMIHRLGAILASFALFTLFWRLSKSETSSTLQSIGKGLLVLLLIQIMLGITNVVYLLPLSVAVLHTGIGALLLVKMIALQFYVRKEGR
jgi:heme a synthase